MKKIMIFATLLALLVPGAAFAGASTDAALGLGAFAVFNQMISGTGVFGVLHPAPRPVFVPAPPPPVIVQPQYYPYYPVYVPAPVHRAPVHYRPVYHAPKRVIVIKERVVVPPGHARPGHPGRGWR